MTSPIIIHTNTNVRHRLNNLYFDYTKKQLLKLNQRDKTCHIRKKTSNR